MSFRSVFLFFVLFSFVNAIASKQAGKTLVRYFDSRDLEDEVQSKTFSMLRKSLRSNSKLTFKEVDCSLETTDCSILNNKVLPSYLLFNGTQLDDIYYGPQDLETLRSYCLVQLGFKQTRSLAAKADAKASDSESLATLLTSANFKDGVKNNITFVMFFAPWCGICKKYKPLWNQLAEKYQNHPNINIARVDCVAEQQSRLCFKQKVSGFPTLNLYKDGKYYKEYESGRKLVELVDFVESHQTEETEAAWEVRDNEREIASEKKKAEKAARKALEAKTAPKAKSRRSSCHVEDKDGLCLAS